MRNYSRFGDLEPFVADLTTNGFRSEVRGCGARDFVHRLQAAGPGVVVRLRSTRPVCACGEPLVIGEDGSCPFCLQRRQLAAVDAHRRAVA